MNKLKITLAAALVISAAGANAVNKCSLPNGTFVYQDLPCESKPVAFNAAPASGAGPSGAEEVADVKWRREVMSAISRRYILIGMTEKEARQSWGSPSKINSTISAGTTSEQWIYRGSYIGGDSYVYVRNGIVTSMQTAR
jgi:hypothetical protein